jgi:phosphoglycerate kinase
MSSAFRTLDQADVAGKRVLVRVDLNVPMENGKVTDITRIERVAPTIKEIADKGGKVILLAHFGRPKGCDPKESLKPIVATVAHVIGRKVAFADDCVGDAAEKAVGAMKNGEILLLENTRFHKEEEKNEAAFVEQLAKLGDIFVNDAFSAAHRAHASTEGLAHKLPAYAGRTMQAELEALTKALEAPQRPVIAIVGGAKVSTKLELLENLITKVEGLVIGGAMANTFLHAQGVDVGKSLAEKDMADTARRILAKAEEASCTIILPVDATVAFHFEANAPSHAYGLDAIPRDGMVLDIGRQSVERIKGALDDAATLVWNGPLGAFEMPPFDTGTVAVARYAAERTRSHGLVSVAGGGDTVAALNAAHVADKFTYVSTAGGAFLEWLEGRKLPGVEALRAS